MEMYVLFLTAIILGYWYWKNSKSSKNLPPGPIGIPVIGYVPSMNKNQHLSFSKLRAKYGDIFSFYIGQQLFVVLASYDVIKNALTKHGNNLAARPVPASIILSECPDTDGLIFNSGKLFTEFKQMALTGIKSFTRSNGIGEAIVTNEIQRMFQEIDKNRDKPTDVREVIDDSVINIAWFWLFGERKDKNDVEFKETLELFQKCLNAIQTAGIEYAFPWLFSIPFVRNMFQASTVVDNYRLINRRLNDKVDDVESSSKNDNEFTFVREWFKLHPKGSDDYDFYRYQLPSVLKDLISAGMETTALTLQWAILYMMEYPNIQHKVQAEIVEVIGKFNKPTTTDKSKMPFTEATIMEIYRMSSILPMSVPYRNKETTIVNGYTIPHNSIVLANLWEIHHDPKTFPNPEEFRPDRFLNDGQLKKVEELNPFSIGKRQCIGESLARMEVFLFFTSLLQRYTFKKPEGVKLDLSCDFSFFLRPRPYAVLAIPN